MPSPDFSQYVDLTTYDVQPQDLYQTAVAYAKTALPEFNPRPGTVEDALMQAGAIIGASAMGAINRLPDELMEGILRVMGVERNEPTNSTVEVVFSLFNAADTVTEDSVFSFDYFDGVSTRQFPFILEEPVTASAGSTTVNATLRSLILGQIPSLTVGTELVAQSPGSVVVSCTTTAQIEQGANGELESEFFARAATYLQSLSATLNTAKQVENYILRTYAGVKRVKAYDLAKAVEHRAKSGQVGGATTAATGNGTTATITTTSAHGLQVGHVVTVAGITPSGYNGTHAVTAVPSSTQLSYASATSGAQTVAGTVSLVGNSSHAGTAATVMTSSSFEDEVDDYPGTIYRIITPDFYGESAFAEDFPSGTFDETDDSLAVSASGVVTYTDVVSDTDATGPLVDVVMLDSLLLSYMENETEAGHFVVFVCGEDGEPVGRSVRQEIEEDIAERVPAGLVFKILDAWTYDIDFQITVAVSPGFNASSVGQAVKDELEGLVSPDEWLNFESSVRVFEIVAAASNVRGVDYVSSFEADIPEYPNSFKGNEKLVQEVTAGAQVTGYSALYAGLLPRASVEVITL